MDTDTPVNHWVDERGNDVYMLPGFSRVYMDDESSELDKKFKFYGFILLRKGSELGKAELEYIAEHLLLVCKLYNKVVGFGEKEFLAFAELLGTGDCFHSKLPRDLYLREKWVMGIRVFFPTEKLLQAFSVPQR